MAPSPTAGSDPAWHTDDDELPSENRSEAENSGSLSTEDAHGSVVFGAKIWARTLLFRQSFETEFF